MAFFWLVKKNQHSVLSLGLWNKNVVFTKANEILPNCVQYVPLETSAVQPDFLKETLNCRKLWRIFTNVQDCWKDICTGFPTSFFLTSKCDQFTHNRILYNYNNLFEGFSSTFSCNILILNPQSKEKCQILDFLGEICYGKILSYLYSQKLNAFNIF